MLRTLVIIAALAFAASTASATPTLDAKGKCRDNGKFVSASLCKTSAPTTSTVSSGRCRDAKGKFIKCPAAAPAPAAATTSTTTTTASASAKGPKHCVKGKPCGNTCISVKDVCHK